MSLINSNFGNFRFLMIQTFSQIKKQIIFYKIKSIETSFNNCYYLVSIDFKYHDINYFNKLRINKNSSLATIYLNIASLSKHFENLQNSVSLLKHFLNIIGISEHKITRKRLKNINF